MTFDAFIKVHYGTQDTMDLKLGLGSKTVNRWFNHDPKKFLYHLPEITEYTKTSADVVMEMIKQREHDIQSVRHGHK